MTNVARCSFQNKYMTSPCNKPLKPIYNELWCIDHGTVKFVAEAYDAVETPEDTLEAENGGQSWSQEEVDKLLEMEEQGFPADEIAKVLKRSKNSVYNKRWAIKGQQ
jgi:hypothetical protein